MIFWQSYDCLLLCDSTALMVWVWPVGVWVGRLIVKGESNTCSFPIGVGGKGVARTLPVTSPPQRSCWYKGIIKNTPQRRYGSDLSTFNELLSFIIGTFDQKVKGGFFKMLQLYLPLTILLLQKKSIPALWTACAIYLRFFWYKGNNS